MNRQEQIVRTKTLKNKNLVLILSIIFLTVFLFNTINSLIYLLIPFGGIVLIINGIEMLIASFICLIILKKRKHYICPVCGNIIHTMGENINSCCGINLPILDAEIENEKHTINCQIVEDEYFISLEHEMTKEHYISFIAYITDNRYEIVKLYPEQNAEVIFYRRGKGIIYAYCNKDGLIKKYL